MARVRRFKTNIDRRLEKQYTNFIYGYACKPIYKVAIEELEKKRYQKGFIKDSWIDNITKRLDKVISLADEGRLKEYIIAKLRNIFITNKKKQVRVLKPDLYTSAEVKLAEEDNNLIFEHYLINATLIKNLMIDQKGKAIQILQDGFYNGKEVKSVAEELKKALDTSLFRAETIAITELARANERINRKELLKAGITKVKWSTARDDRVRPCHRDREGKEFELEKGCYSDCDGKYIRVGEEIRCRCAYLIVFDENLIK